MAKLDIQADVSMIPNSWNRHRFSLMEKAALKAGIPLLIFYQSEEGELSAANISWSAEAGNISKDKQYHNPRECIADGFSGIRNLLHLDPNEDWSNCYDIEEHWLPADLRYALADRADQLLDKYGNEPHRGWVCIYVDNDSVARPIYASLESNDGIELCVVLDDIAWLEVPDDTAYDWLIQLLDEMIDMELEHPTMPIPLAEPGKMAGDTDQNLPGIGRLKELWEDEGSL